MAAHSPADQHEENFFRLNYRRSCLWSGVFPVVELGETRPPTLHHQLQISRQCGITFDVELSIPVAHGLMPALPGGRVCRDPCRSFNIVY